MISSQFTLQVRNHLLDADNDEIDSLNLKIRGVSLAVRFEKIIDQAMKHTNRRLDDMLVDSELWREDLRRWAIKQKGLKTISGAGDESLQKSIGMLLSDAGVDLTSVGFGLTLVLSWQSVGVALELQ